MSSRNDDRTERKTFGLKEKPGEMVEERSLGFYIGVKKNTFFFGGN